MSPIAVMADEDPVATHYASTVGKTCSEVFGMVSFDNTLVPGIMKVIIGYYVALFIYRKIGLLLKRG